MPKKKAEVTEDDAILTPVYHIARIARSLERLEDAFLRSIIAQHGTEEDRAFVVKHLRA